MARSSALERHPHRARLENELLSGKNIMVISAESGISTSSLYRARTELIAEKESHAEATADASRLGAAKRLAQLAADARRARQDAKLAGNGRLAKDLLETERRLLNDIVTLSPELEQTEDQKEEAAFAEVLAQLLEQGDQHVIQFTAKTLRALNAPSKLTEAIEQLARQTHTKEAA